MNRSYNIVWNAARNMYMVAAEFVHSGGVRRQVRIATIAMGALLSANAYSDVIGPQSGASITIEDNVSIESYDGVTGIDSTTAGGSGVQINGGAHVLVEGGSGSLIGVQLDNGTNNDLGSGSSITVDNTNTESPVNITGLLVGNQQSNTTLTADHLQITINPTNSETAYGFEDVGQGGSTDLGQGSSISVANSGNNAYGVYLANGSGDFNMDDGTIWVGYPEYGVAQNLTVGLYSSGDASVNLGSNTDVLAYGNSNVTGISIGNSGSLNADNLSITVNGLTGMENGLELGNNSHADIGTGGTLYADGSGTLVQGITVNGGSSFTADNFYITVLTTNTNSPTGRGILLNGNGASADLGSDSTVEMSGFYDGSGIDLMTGSGTFSADNLTVDVSGNRVYGIQEDGGSMNLGVGSTVSATGTAETIWVNGGDFTASGLTVNTAQSTGINAQGGSANVVVSVGEDSVVDGRNVGADGSTNGISATYAGFGSSTTTFNFNGSAANRNEIYAVNGYGASSQFSGQTMNISNTDITMSGDGKSRGLWAIGDNDMTSGGVINGDNLTIDMTAAGANSVGVEVQQGGIVNLTGNTTITTDGGVAIRNAYTTDSKGTFEPGGTITGSGDMTIEGDIVSDGWGSIDLTMDTQSNFTGATSVNADITDLDPDAYSTLNLTLANQAQWTVTDDSSLTDLTNDGKVVLASDMENGTYSTLDADTITLQDNSELDVDYAAAQASQGGAPLITGGTITLDGDLKVSDSEVSDLSDLTSDQQLSQGKIVLIDADSAINGNFSSLSMDSADQPDYLAFSGQINPNDDTQYLLGAGLSWYADSASTVSTTAAHGTFTLDSGKSFEVTSALVDVAPDATTGWDGKTLTKKGDGTLILSGDNSYSGGTDIDDGELLATNVNALGTGDIDNRGQLTLDANSAFNLTQNITTESGGITQINQGSTLTVNTLTQEDGSSLNVYLDLSSTQPVITAQQANLDGVLNITGVADDPNHQYTGSVTVIDAAQDITGDFDSLTIAGAPASQVDFINVEGRVDSVDSTNYDLTFGLTWYADRYNSTVPADGTFTLADASQSFTLGAVLEDVAPNSDSGWDGKTLTKKGDGTLILDAVNTYSGATNVEEGALWLDPNAVIGVEGSQQLVDVAQGAAFGGDNATVNGNVENRGSLYFDNTFTVNGDVTNSGAIISGSGTIPLPATQLTDSGQPDNTLVINGDYTGNGGSLTLNTYLGDDSSPTDKLVVNGNTSGDTTLYINQSGGEGAQTTDGIEVVQVNGTSDGVFTQGNQVQAGLYEYRLYQDSGDGDWYLRSQSTSPTPPDPDDGGDDGGDGGDTPVTPQYRADIGAYLGNQWMARSLQMQTLYDREGSQYHNDDGSVWARFKAGSADSQAARGNVDIDNNYSQFQLGGDILTWGNGAQSLTVGLMGSYINADTDSTGNRGADGSRFSASGNVDGYNLGVYATWFADAQNHSGMYVDSWYQYGTFNNSVDDGDVGSENYDSTANAVSLETGYRYDITLSNNNVVSLTPQAQVTWQNYQADSVTDNSGTHINGQNGDSWTSRMGLRVDGKLHKSQNSVIQPFMEANWLHTSDDTSVSFDSNDVKQDIPADRAELKAGIQTNINQQWSVTAQVAGQKGSNDYDDLNGSLNVRYSW